MGIHFDHSLWPLVIVRFEKDASEREFEDYLRQLETNLERAEPLAYVFDATASSRPPRAQQVRQGEWMEAHLDAMVAHCKGTAFVFTSPVFRFVLSAVFLVQPQPVPYTVCATPAEGETWARERLRKAGVSVPHRVARPGASG